MNPSSDFQGSSRSELARWLELHGLDTKAFNQPPAKTLDMLLHECLQGETQLKLTDAGKPLRIVSFVSVLIHDRKGRTLIETCQTLPSQVRRSRNLPLSEKLRPGEGWREAAMRGIKEELGSILPKDAEIHLLDESYSMGLDQRPSPSYPGLQTQYVKHTVEALVRDLPEGPFVTVEEHHDGDMVVQWEWRELP